MVLIDRCRGNTWTVCKFHGSNGNGFGDIWWTDNPMYFISIDKLRKCVDARKRDRGNQTLMTLVRCVTLSELLDNFGKC